MAEEWEKREELERLQDEQKMLLDEERVKRQEYEERQRQKEEQLRSKGKYHHQAIHFLSLNIARCRAAIGTVGKRKTRFR